MFKSDERVEREAKFNANRNRIKPETKGGACTCNPIQNGLIGEDIPELKPTTGNPTGEYKVFKLHKPLGQKDDVLLIPVVK